MTVESDIGALRAKVDRLEIEVDSLEKENREIRALLNRGRGAVWVLIGIGTAATFAVTQWRAIAGLLK